MFRACAHPTERRPPLRTRGSPPTARPSQLAPSIVVSLGSHLHILPFFLPRGGPVVAVPENRERSLGLIKLVGMASSMSSGASTSALRFWASRFLRRQESHVGALSALGARGYKTTTGIVGVEVDPEAPETLRHLLKKILRVSLEEGRTARRGRGWGGAREGGRPFQPFPSARDASSRAWPRGSRRESGKKNLE